MATEEHLAMEPDAAIIARNFLSGSGKTPAELAGIVSVFASSEGWMEKVRLRADRRWYERLHLGPDYDIWVISWLPGQSTGFHDHGASSGAFIVATGTLEEHRPGEQVHTVPAGTPRSFGPGYAHDVRNASLAPAISIHAYSPPLDEMNEYDLDEGRLIRRDSTSHEDGTIHQKWVMKSSEHLDAPKASISSIDQVLSAARARLRRLSPSEAFEAVANDAAIFVDIRPERQRACEGTIPGALTIERNVLEWRLDPASSARLSMATDYGLRLIVFCSEGYTSSLAAASLQDLGLYRATDIIGGFRAWREAGLPIL